jgi:hypothetical protein
LLAVLVFLVAAVHFAYLWRLPTPICWLRTLTGIPCPGCGSTRCFFALSHLDFARAFRLNPLTFLACVAVAAWFVLWTADQCLHRGWAVHVGKRLQRLPLAVIVPVMVALNWIYLYFALPR